MRIEPNAWYLTRDKKHVVYVSKLIYDEHGYLEGIVASDGIQRNYRGTVYNSGTHNADLMRTVTIHYNLVSNNPC